ncbi:serine/threonine protein phosphatase PrpC [Actinokineospora baliensis]|uniref:protein phosphatase 2C domain-containing protein n=1 Tax=Actinokineospora baliensis TaxID=547056 RepID=UPI00195B9684|nr:protein phosphatase 2C domain-containing protein [Actinokineospora baliensis]MBM7773432.1 serine/threonine protein phosphatase PrpC [Actinokineospora baliensis]
MTALVCVNCGATLQPGWLFCEDCGRDQRALPTGEPRVEHSTQRPDLDLDRVAAITDRGRRRERNEDAVAIGTLGDVAAAVVCDGVASAPGSEMAAIRAAEAGLAELLAAIARGEEPIAATTAAANSAADAAALLGDPSDKNPPCCTYVSALVTAEDVTVGWVGDSPAYWAGSTGMRRLTVDDSAAGRLIAQGVGIEDPRMAEPGVHALERWLGADAGPISAQVRRFSPPEPGLVLLCSDGLSRYVDAGLVAPADHLGTPAAVTRTLLGRALAAGGHDNVTVAAITATGGGPA